MWHHVPMALEPWQQEFLESLSEEMPPLTTEQVRGVVRERKEEVFAERDRDDRPNPAPRYLHLRDATVHAGEAVWQVPFWRCPIRAITGWSLGSTGSPPA